MNNDLRVAWERLVESYLQFCATQRDVLSRGDRVSAFREGLRAASPGANGVALYLLDMLTEKERIELLPELLLRASSWDAEEFRKAILRLPKGALLRELPPLADERLRDDDHETYRAIFSIYLRLDVGLARQLANRAAGHPSEEVREAARDFVAQLERSSSS